MKIIIFGLGSIGQRHAGILRDHFDHDLLVFRSGKSDQSNKSGLKEVFNWQEVARIRPEVAFITNPTALHTETALKCAELGMHLFIEKPLSHSLDRILELERLCAHKHLTAYVAYCLRFHPVIKKMKELLEGKTIYHARVVCSSYLPYWRKGTDWEKCYSANKKMGGGVLLDLSHEFDYIQHLFGPISRIAGVHGRLSDVTVDADDFSDILISLANAGRVNLHLNFLSHLNERTIKVDFKDGYLVGDLINGRVEYLYDESKQVIDLPVERNEFTREQTQYFLDNLNNPALMNNLTEARGLLAKILEFQNE